ncbi:hypothetical protein WJX81_000841 [Elliptochloris bilobata]|uniref:Uncharacterized protein n=1 Tax=Elliptochloris bilobata TaxID=381761 RepID=A0AAW1SIG5_9CHLO
MDSDRLDALLQELAAKVDETDPQQALLLQEARAHTRALHHARGDWERESSSRSWNADVPPEKDTPPLALPSFRDYAAFKREAEASSEPRRLPVPEVAWAGSTTEVRAEDE